MKKTTFRIPKMDCPSEENLIRMQLESLKGIKNLEFDIPNRTLYVYHDSELSPIEKALDELKFGRETIATEISGRTEFAEERNQKKLLWAVLAINFAFFLIESISGYFSGSMGLVADSLDMLADSFVYGLSLYAIDGSVLKKKKVARMAGYFQITLAVLGFSEVLRRLFGMEQLPGFRTMIIVSILALAANGLSLYLLQRSKSKEAHMQASMIFTSNDVIINIGVIIAAILVAFTGSGLPDLIIGSIVFLIVIRGALKILKLGR